MAWIGANNRPITPPAPPPPPAAQINWNPGHYWTVTNGYNFQGVATVSSEMDVVIGQDPTNICKGFEITFILGQCEGAFGDYSAWFANVQAMLDKVNSYNPKRSLSIALNNTGNVNQGGVPAYMVDNATYGPTGGTPGGVGAHGGYYQTTSGGKVTRFDNANTCARIAAAGAALYSHFGNQIFAFNPLFSEVQGMSTFVPGMTDTVITDALVGTLFPQLRAGMPKTYLKFSPSYITQPNLIRMYNMTDQYYVSCGVYDSCNETGGVSSRQISSVAAFRGGSYSGGAFVPNYPGLRDRRAAVGGQDWHSFTNGDELTHRSNSVAVPPAWLCDGRLPIVWDQEILMQTSHKFWLSQRSYGPRCNITGTTATAPADYAGVTWTGGLPGFARTVTVPTLAYPSNWP